MANSNLHNLFSALISNIKSYTGKDPILPWLRNHGLVLGFAEGLNVDKCLFYRRLPKLRGIARDDGTYYFDEKLFDTSGTQGPLSATSSVVRGLTTFAAAALGGLNLPDYHEIIENPMDFGTLRNKLDDGLYTNLEELEMAQLPEGITKLLHHEKLQVPLIKCHNVIILSATNVAELDGEWDCLIESTRSNGILPLAEPFVSKHFTTSLSEMEVAQPLSKLISQFSDIYIGCHRKSRNGPLIISFKGKDEERIESAAEALTNKLPSVVTLKTT